MIELFECIALGARISKATCQQNRKRGGTGGHGKGPEKIFACVGCPGVGGDPITIDFKTTEVPEMTVKSKRVAKKCSVKGCDKSAQHGCDGMCKAHFRDACTEAGVTPEMAKTDLIPGKPAVSKVVADLLDLPEISDAVDPLSAAGKDFPEWSPVIDPRNTYVCPHCAAVLSTDEAEKQTCPVCKQQMRYEDQGFQNAMDMFVSANEIRESLSDAPVITSREASPFEVIGMQIGSLVTEKNQAYGNSFAQSGDFLQLLYPAGVQPDQFQEALGMVRIFDKMKRIATDKDAFGEDQYRDIAGYAILAVARREGAI